MFPPTERRGAAFVPDRPDRASTAIHRWVGLALDFIESVMRGTDYGFGSARRAEVVRRFNQLSSPLAARAVQDTTFYRYRRLLSRNDVRFDAGTLAVPVERFHDLMSGRAIAQPGSMPALETHDHKRGPNARAWLAVMSAIPTEWPTISNLWFDLNDSVRPSGLHAGDEYFFSVPSGNS